MHTSAKSTCVPPQVALGTEGSELIVCPLLGRNAVLREAVVTKSPRVPPAVNAGAAQHSRRAHGQHLDLSRCLIHGRTEGKLSGIDGTGMLGPDVCGQCAII